MSEDFFSYGTGWLEEEESDKDYQFEKTAAFAAAVNVPKVDLREYASSIHNQGRTSSCVAQAVVSALELRNIYVIKNKGEGVQPGVNFHELSRLHLYYVTRTVRGENYTKVDNGSYTRHALYAMKKLGIAPEKQWPFVTSNINKRPPMRVLVTSYENKCGSFYKIKGIRGDRVKAIRAALSKGYPVVYGTRVGKNWQEYRGEAADGAVLSKPKKVIGGHATVLVGYSDDYFIGQNSWGTRWGMDGFYYIDKETVGDPYFTRDIWVVTTKEDDLNLLGD